MARARDILFTAALSALLLGALGFSCARLSALSGGQEPERSYLEGRPYQSIPELTAESVSAGRFQDGVERFAADSIPWRDRVLLYNAALQRTEIRAAAAPFGYGEYPTYLGSSYVYSEAEGSLSELPLKRGGGNEESLSEFSGALRGLAEAHPGVRWRLALVDRSAISAANPAHDLASDQMDYAYILPRLKESLAGSCEVVDLSVIDAEEYYRKYFRTDHHWQIDGAIDAYESIMASLDKEPLSEMELFAAYSGPFFGSSARNGRCTEIADSVRDVRYKRSKLEVYVNGSPQPESYLDSLYEASREYEKESLYDNVYGTYFHDDPALIEIRNADLVDGPALLIIGDSFTNNVERLFAEAYGTVYVVDPRFYRDSLNGFLNEHDVDDAVLIASSNTLFNDDAITEIAS